MGGGCTGNASADACSGVSVTVRMHEQDAELDHVCSDEAPQLLTELELHLRDCIEALNMPQLTDADDAYVAHAAAAGAVSRPVLVVMPPEKELSASLELLGCKVIKVNIDANLKRGTKCRLSVASGVPWVLGQVQNAHNRILRACGEINVWRECFGGDPVEFAHQTCLAMDRIIAELSHARNELLHPSGAGFPRKAVQPGVRTRGRARCVQPRLTLSHHCCIFARLARCRCSTLRCRVTWLWSLLCGMRAWCVHDMRGQSDAGSDLRSQVLTALALAPASTSRITAAAPPVSGSLLHQYLYARRTCALWQRADSLHAVVSLVGDTWVEVVEEVELFHPLASLRRALQCIDEAHGVCSLLRDKMSTLTAQSGAV